MRVTHADRELFHDPPLTKAALARWYAGAAPLLLPQLAGRPLTFVRCPGGLDGRCFVQRHLAPGQRRGLREVPTPDGRRGLVVEEADGLVELVQNGVVELHTWGSRLPRLDRPDRLTLDLDPGPRVRWPAVVAAARLVRERLESAGLAAFLKTTGGKGLHVVAPLEPRAGWDDVLGFARDFAAGLVEAEPAAFVARLAKSGRSARILVDYLRNGVAASAVSAWSVRARPGAPVSVPLAWDELDPRVDVRGAHFAVTGRRVAAALRAGDAPWRGYEDARVPLPRQRRTH